MTPPKTKILLVDDEPQLLEGLSRTLRGAYDVATAPSGPAALEILEADRSFAIVVSDMRMPTMNGSTFLAKASVLAPDAVRILLSGQSDMDDAIAAINDGHIFRFLRKPCPRETMTAMLAAASEQHRLIVSERELLEQTLRGSVHSLSETLALANPGVFGIATRVKRLAGQLAAVMKLEKVWQLEIAATVCQLGAVSIPLGVLERRSRRESLTGPEREMLAKVPEVSERLIAHIPRLEAVCQVVRYSGVDFDAKGPLPLHGTNIPLAARVLHVSIDFEERQTAGDSAFLALEWVRSRSTSYDPTVLAALGEILASGEAPCEELPIAALRQGMIVASDIRTRGGMLLVARGHEVTSSLLARLENFGGDLATKVVRVAS